LRLLTCYNLFWKKREAVIFIIKAIGKMYINFSELHRQGIEPQDLLFLIAIKQKDEEAIELYFNGDILDIWMEKEWIRKLKKGDLRIDTKGQKLLKKLSTSSEDISETTVILIDWLIKIYKNKQEGIVKNKKETQRRCQWFADETGITENKLAVLLKCFVED